MKKLLLYFSFNLFTYSICFSQWVQTSGPPGGTVTAIAANSQYLFAAVHGDGVYRTQKDTIAWQLVSNGLTNITVNALGVMADRLFAGTSTGVFRSDDNGDNWINQTSQVNEFVNCFTSDNDEIYAGCTPFVYLSVDSGVTWSPLPSGQYNHYDLLLINNKIYSGCDDFLGSPGWGVRLSSDHGATWTPITNGLNNYGVRSLAVIQDHFFAGTIGHGVYRSTLSIPTWSPSNIDIGNLTIFHMIVIDSMLIALTDNGLYSTTDYGDTWNEWAQLLSDLTPISIYRIDSMIFIGTQSGGLFETNKDGSQFTALGFPKALIYSMEANDSVAVCIGGNFDEIYRTYNAGSSWQNLGKTYQGYVQYTFSMYLDGGDLFLATSGGCFLSEDYGDSWQMRNTGINNDIFCQLISKGKNALYLASQENLYRSVNNGDSWQMLNNPNEPYYFDVIQVAEDDNFIFASTVGGSQQIFRSGDLGQTWENISTGPLYNQRIYNIKFCHERLIVLATDDNLALAYYSDDEGSTWIQVPINSGLTTTDADDLFTKGDSAIVSTGNGKIFISADKGTSWTDMSEGLPFPTFGIYDVAINGNYLLATDYYAGVWRRPISEIFTGVPLNNFSIEPPDIFPNPVSDQLNIRLVPSTQWVILDIHDIYGTKLRSLKMRCTAGQQVSFDASHLIAGLPSGVYQVTVTEGNKRHSTSVIKMLSQ